MGTHSTTCLIVDHTMVTTLDERFVSRKRIAISAGSRGRKPLGYDRHADTLMHMLSPFPFFFMF